MTKLIMKFGGDSLSSIKKIKNAAGIIKKRKEDFSKIIVVVSAMGSMTDKLLKLAKKIVINPHKREQDMLISSGERISMSLLAMALFSKDVKAISFTGSQSGIITTNEHFNAKIIDVKPRRIIENYDDNVVIVAGFQGVSMEGEVTTLGRGGSDTTAVALAVSLGASIVEFYKDVDGIYSKDPKKYLNANRIDELCYEEALKIVGNDGVLHSRAIGLAKRNGIIMKVLSYRNCVSNGSVVRGENVSIGAVYEIE